MLTPQRIKTCSLYILHSEVYVSNSRNAFCVRLISEAKLSESGKDEGQIKLLRQKAISRRKTKGTADAQEPEPECYDLTRARERADRSSDHYTGPNNTRRFYFSRSQRIVAKRKGVILTTAQFN